MKVISLIVLLLTSFFNSICQNSHALSKESKVALVVGVANYEYANPLKNTLNDANDMAAKLEQLGFKVVKLLDPNLKAMASGVDSFTHLITGADVCLFYYSGHGAEVNGENYLFPKNSNPQVPNDLIYEAYPIGKLVGKLEFAGAKTSILLLDACRNNPFVKKWSKGTDKNGGLANIDAPSGTFIGFAASPGKTASDGTHRNGTYTEAILKFIESRNTSIDQVFNMVNKEVRVQSEGKQIPYKNSSLEDDFYFFKDISFNKIKDEEPNVPKSEYKLAPLNRPQFPISKTRKGYINENINTFASVSINKSSFHEDEFIELYLSLLGENIWDKATPIYVEITKRLAATSYTRVFKEEFQPTGINTRIRISSSLESGEYELAIGFYFINELNTDFPLFYNRKFKITIY